MNHRSRIVAIVAAAALSLGVVACEDSANPIQVVTVEVRGTYDIAALTFDPQGILPSVDLKSRIAGTIPRLTLAANGRAQLVFIDPETGLFTISEATYSLTNAGAVKLDFGTANTLYTKTFLSRNMTFSYDSSTHVLAFAGASPDGVTRARLLQLVPEWQNEQLLDPVPGVLSVRLESTTVTTQ